MKLRLMADYECYPTWALQPLAPGLNIAPAQLPISESLQRELNAWAALYDETLDRDDPVSSGFASSEQEDAFEQTGLRLADALRSELGPASEVTYVSRRDMPPPSSDRGLPSRGHRMSG